MIIKWNRVSYRHETSCKYFSLSSPSIAESGSQVSSLEYSTIFIIKQWNRLSNHHETSRYSKYALCCVLITRMLPLPELHFSEYLLRVLAIPLDSCLLYNFLSVSLIRLFIIDLILVEFLFLLESRTLCSRQ
jgi:hypothetical protein